MKIAVICSKVPFPSKDGGTAATLSFIESLIPVGEISLLCIATEKHPDSESCAFYFKEKQIDYQSVFISTKIHIGKALLGFIQNKNYNLSRFTSFEWKLKLTSFFKESYDVIILDGLFSIVEINLIQSLTSSKIIYRAHNIEFKIWEELAKNASFFKRYYLRSLAKSLQKEEFQLIANCAQIWTISEDDKLFFEKKSLKAKITLIPFGIKTSENTSNQEEFFYTFLGSMDWIPNQETVVFLIKTWNEYSIKRTLFLAGKNMEKVPIPSNKYIQNKGTVENSSDYLAKGILLCPVFSGSGIRIKILEALSHGLPVVTTHLGAQGISIEKSGIIIINHAEEINSRLENELNERSIRENLSKKGRNYIKEVHNFEQITKKIQLLLEK